MITLVRPYVVILLFHENRIEMDPGLCLGNCKHKREKNILRDRAFEHVLLFRKMKGLGKGVLGWIYGNVSSSLHYKSRFGIINIRKLRKVYSINLFRINGYYKRVIRRLLSWSLTIHCAFLRVFFMYIKYEMGF